ncbi:MAG TPA: helix-turn-helix domain-containing protein [Cellulomonas sp.]
MSEPVLPGLSTDPGLVAALGAAGGFGAGSVGQPVTVADLVALPGVTGVELLGHGDVDAPVRHLVALRGDQVLARAHDRAAPLPALAGAAVLLEDAEAWQREGRDFVLDLALRVAADEGAATVLVPHARPVPVAAALLAERLGVSVLRVAGPEPLRALADLALAVARPDVLHAHALRRAATAITTEQLDLSALLRAVAATLDGVVAVQSGARLLQAERGATAVDQPAFQTVHLRHGGTAYTEISNGRAVAVQPVPLPAEVRERPLLLVAQRRGGGRLWRALALDVLQVARNAVAAWAINRFLVDERERLARARLLQELLAEPDALTPRAQAEAAALGWELDGWHTAVHLRATEGGPVHGATLSVVEDLLRQSGLGAAGLVPQATGAVSWLTAPELAGLPSAVDLAARLDPVLEFLAEEPEGQALTAGLGAARRGPVGLARSIVEARRASVLPVPPGSSSLVRHGLGRRVDRVLALWDLDPLLRQESRTVVEPLLGEPALLATLRAFLDAGGSAAGTARALGVHRNTVRYRLAQIEQRLGVALTEHDTRIALAVALRLTPDAAGQAGTPSTER